MLKKKIPPALLMLVFGVLMWGLAKSPVGFVQMVPAAGLWSAVLMFLGGLVIAAGLVQFHRARTTVNPFAPESATMLVTDGIFSYTRNPMYLGMLLILLGLAVRLGSPVNVVLLATFVAFITRFQISPEEQALRRLFGEQFDRYCARVRRWI